MMKRVRTTLQRASKVVEAPRRRTEEVVRRLAENPEFDLMDAPRVARDLLHIGREQADQVRALLDERIRRRLNTIGLATQDDVDRLKRRIAELEASAASRGAAGGTAATAEEVAPARRSPAARGRARPPAAGRTAAAQPARGRAGAATTGRGAGNPARPSRTGPAQGRARVAPGEPADRAGGGAEPEGGAGE
jgi:polyhydroxyalkanoate synthesis regulator phasin